MDGGGALLDCRPSESTLYARNGPGGDRTCASPPSGPFAAAHSFRQPGRETSPPGVGTMRPGLSHPRYDTRRRHDDPGRDALIIGLRGFKDFQGDTVSHPPEMPGVSLSLPLRSGRLLPARPRLSDGRVLLFRERLGEAIQRQMAGKAAHRPPAVLGLRSLWQGSRHWGRSLGASAFEIPMLPPSIPGTRIFHRFQGRSSIAKGGDLPDGASAIRAYG